MSVLQELARLDEARAQAAEAERQTAEAAAHEVMARAIMSEAQQPGAKEPSVEELAQALETLGRSVEDVGRYARLMQDAIDYEAEYSDAVLQKGHEKHLAAAAKRREQAAKLRAEADRLDAETRSDSHDDQQKHRYRSEHQAKHKANQELLVGLGITHETLPTPEAIANGKPDPDGSGMTVGEASWHRKTEESRVRLEKENQERRQREHASAERSHIATMNSPPPPPERTPEYHPFLSPDGE